MNKGLIQKLLPHAIAVAVFLIVAVIYCRPVLQGEVLHQEDVTQWNAMAKNSFDYKAAHGHFPLWTNGMFSGMPAYQIAMEPDVPITPAWFYGIFTLFLPKPISFFFLACVCFYFLALVLRVRPYIALFGALAYAYATYNPIIIVVGHDTKMWAIAMMPAFLASLILLYERKYVWGTALTALFTALLIGVNHLQIVYYMLIIVVFMTAAYAIRWIRAKKYKHLLLAGTLAIAAGAIGVLSNAVQILTTLDAAKTTIRGGTELADKNSGVSDKGLSKEYALSYSMYKTEPFVMMAPNIYGGSGAPIEEYVEDSKAVKALQSMPEQLSRNLSSARRSYWGGVGTTSGPPYVGAIVCFLALIGFFLLGNKHKWWILGACVFTLLMSWGEYFEGFNTFLLNVLPMYNKFRAPSMIIVVPTLLFGMMAVMTMQAIVSAQDKGALWNRYKKGLFLTAGAFAVLLLIYFNADFSSEVDKDISKNIATAPNEVKEYVRPFLSGLKEDRQSLFLGSVGRSLFFVAAAAFILWLAIRRKMQAGWLFAIIGVLAFIDLMTVDVKYLKAENYQDAATAENNIPSSPADERIQADKSYYRVFDIREGAASTLTYGARTANFHFSIGGYHPAKLSIYQDLIAKQLSRPGIEQQLFTAPGSIPVINMLNTKYIIQTLQAGEGTVDSVLLNPNAAGAAWFVNAVKTENDAASVMNDLTNLSIRDTAVIFAADKGQLSYTPGPTTGDSIWLVKNDNDEIIYKYSASAPRFAVFSEVFYKQGWKAFVDGKELSIIRTNYVLRGLSLPAAQGKEIRFEFHPASYYTGETMATVAGILVFLLLIGAIVQEVRQRKKGDTTVPASNARRA